MSDRKRSVGSIQKHLLSQSRQSMISAVQIYNSPTISFKSESFIVLSIIAWTYLLHSYYRSKGIDYRYYKTSNGRKKYDKTKRGAYKYWELERCIDCDDCPLDSATKANLRFLIGIRHEIEHHMNSCIDDAIRGKIQSCCINYNYYIAGLFGEKYAVDEELGYVVQFSNISPEQKNALLNERLPKNVRNFIVDFESGLTVEEATGPHYEYRIVFEGYCSSKKSDADKVIKFEKYDSSQKDGTVFIKEVEKKKYISSEIVSQLQNLGYSRFTMTKHTELWKKVNAKQNSMYFVEIKERAFWYDSWLKYIIDYCSKHEDEYK